MQTRFVESDSNNQLGRGGRVAETRGVSGPKQITARKIKRPRADPSGNGNVNGSRTLIEALANSKIYQEYERAFTEMTDLPLALLPVETWQLPHHGKRNENPFCALMTEKSRACSACLQVQELLCEQAADEAHTVACPARLCDTAVPIKLGKRLIGFLHTGQVFRKIPTKEQFDRLVKLVAGWGVEVESETLRRTYFATKVVPPRQHDGVVKLLTIFAQHLAMLGHQIFAQRENAEPPVIKRAKQYIFEHQAEDLTLGRVAREVNTSRFYFCKIFKKFTGINYTDYLSCVRIEKAKNLLLNPNLRVSEIAYEVGFQSLTHFNRVFKKILGQSPTEYRTRLIVH